MRDDAGFLADLDRSKASAILVAERMTEAGYRACWKPIRVRPDQSQRDQYADDGDIHLTLRVEVKHRKLAFTGPHDFKFPTIIIDSKRLIDKRLRSLWGYFICNDALTHAAVIRVHTAPLWEVENFYDTISDKPSEVYTMPVDKLPPTSWRRLDEPWPGE